MTKRVRRISDMELVACENLLRDLDHELECLDKDDPANDAKIDKLCSRIAAYEEWALSKPPQSVHGLATQARIARRSCDWTDRILAQMDRLIEAIHTIPDVSIKRPRIRLRANRAYRKRDGTKTNPLSQMDGRGLMFSDDFRGGIWDADGRSTSGSPDHDLVEEIVPEQPVSKQPLRHAPASIENRVTT
jgi:hypothetical protein